MKAFVVLEDGKVFEGKSFGVSGEVVCDVVFCTDMVGYQETLTNLENEKKAVLMTYTMIGNSGISKEYSEKKISAAGIIVKEACVNPSNHTSVMTLGDYLKKNGTIGIEGVDTREFMRHIRNNPNVKKAVLYAGDDVCDFENLAKKAKA
jgi:carbamoyl-phosphate synthase small subunit